MQILRPRPSLLNQKPWSGAQSLWLGKPPPGVLMPVGVRGSLVGCAQWVTADGLALGLWRGEGLAEKPGKGKFSGLQGGRGCPRVSR